jgi:hypothetical protein
MPSAAQANGWHFPPTCTCRPFYYESGVALFGSDQAGLDLFGPDAPTQQALEAASGWGGLFTGAAQGCLAPRTIFAR